jgi:hypothetical protein
MNHPIKIGPEYLMLLDKGSEGEARLFSVLAHEMGHAISLRSDNPHLDPAFGGLASCLGERESFDQFPRSQQENLGDEAVADWISAKVTASYVSAGSDTGDRGRRYNRAVEGMICPMYWDKRNAIRSAAPDGGTSLCEGSRQGEDVQIGYPNFKYNNRQVDESNCADFEPACKQEFQKMDCCQAYTQLCKPANHPIVTDRFSMVAGDPDLKKALGCGADTIAKSKKAACRL